MTYRETLRLIRLLDEREQLDKYRARLDAQLRRWASRMRILRFELDMRKGRRPW